MRQVRDALSITCLETIFGVLSRDILAYTVFDCVSVVVVKLLTYRCTLLHVSHCS